MKRVTFIGGIFFKCKYPKKQAEWYNKHLGIFMSDDNGIFKWRDKDTPNDKAFRKEKGMKDK